MLLPLTYMYSNVIVVFPRVQMITYNIYIEIINQN